MPQTISSSPPTAGSIDKPTKMNETIKAFTLVALTAVTAVAAPAVKAENFEGHDRLWQTLERNGVDVSVNHPDYCKDNRGGAMYATFKDGTTAILICQDEGQGVAYDTQVKWTANDLDSLRHEAQHVVQDCLDGGIGDGELSPMFNNEQLKKHVLNTLSRERIEMILKNYDKEDHLIELEAFTVAAAVSPVQIADAVEEFCAAPSNFFRF